MLLHNFIDDLEVIPSSPINQGAFCYLPETKKKEFDDHEFRSFKQSEQRKTDVSMREFELAKTNRRSLKQGVYNSLFRSAPSNEVREHSEKNNRLVITRKSPTDQNTNDRAPMLRVYHREWSGEYRVSVESFTRLQKAPPIQAGERQTSHLTQSAASKIKDAGAYVATTKTGFKTFCTLTFTPEQQLNIDNGETTIGREVSRFMDGIQKKSIRGWEWLPPSNELKGLNEPLRIEGREDKLNYIWVAENPDRKINYTTPEGEVLEVTTGTNPHVHFLMDWSVPKELFRDWAKQIESLWGNGFAKLEKVRNPHSATGYLLKALGYMTKGGYQVDEKTGEIINSQGVIKGNRYGISKSARAPKWECINEFQAAHMGQIVREVGQRICMEGEAIRDRINQAKKLAEKQKAIIAKCNHPAYKAKVPIKTINERLSAAFSAIKIFEGKQRELSNSTRKMDYSNKFKITFRSVKTLYSFLEYAVVKRDWQALQMPKTIKDDSPDNTNHNISALTPWAKVVKKLKQATQTAEDYWTQVLAETDQNEGMILI